MLEQPVTAGEAAAAVDVPALDGALLAVVDHTVVDAHYAPATVTVDGHPARLTSPLPDRAHVQMTSGTDVVEPTAVREVAIPFPDKQKVDHGLWTGGADGAASETYGTRSNQLVTRTVVREPVAPTPLPSARVTLSFDDGPDPTYTPQVLEILRAHGVRAVFCEVGRSVRAHPDTARAVRDAGHVLCNHTQTHADLTKLPAAGMAAEIAAGEASIADVTGVQPPLFRPPYGATNFAVAVTAARGGMAQFLWTVDPKDFDRPGVDAIRDRVVGAVRPGGTVLMHDGGGDRSQTVAALPAIITALQDYGYVLEATG